MAYDEEVARRVRSSLTHSAAPEILERKMFGGLAMMVNGHMCVGVTGGQEDQLHAQAVADRHRQLEDKGGARLLLPHGPPRTDMDMP